MLGFFTSPCVELMSMSDERRPSPWTALVASLWSQRVAQPIDMEHTQVKVLYPDLVIQFWIEVDQETSLTLLWRQECNGRA
jgi:hypothetical protein